MRVQVRGPIEDDSQVHDARIAGQAPALRPRSSERISLCAVSGTAVVRLDCALL
jgi:hypothetical protein